MRHARDSPGNTGSPGNGIPLRRPRHLAGPRPAPPVPLPRMRSSRPMTATIQCGENAAGVVTLAAARAEFDAEVTYLDTATLGLQPRLYFLAPPPPHPHFHTDTPH